MKKAQNNLNPALMESEVSLISRGSSFEGTLRLQSITRFHGILKGKLIGEPNSLIIISETGLIEGEIEADSIWIEGFVRGDVRAKTKITLSSSGRVLGNLQGPSLEIQPGAYFEGQCKMENL